MYYGVIYSVRACSLITFENPGAKFMAKVKGGKISSKLAFVRETYGEAMVEKIVDSMSPTDKASLKIVLDSAWYPLALYDRLLTTVCDVAAGGDESVYTRIGKHSAEVAFTTTYKAFRGKNPVDLVRKMSSMHAMRNDPAEMEVVSQSENHCTVRISKPQSTVTLCKVSRAFFIRAIELCDGRGVRVLEPRCSGRGDAYCEFNIDWETGHKA